MSWRNKVELIQQETDEWMIRWRHFQTADDLKIERNFRSRRQRNMWIGGAMLVGLHFYTVSPATVKRQFGAPHMLDIGFGLEPVGHFVARREAALFGAEIGAFGDHLFAPARLSAAALVREFARTGDYSLALRRPAIGFLCDRDRCFHDFLLESVS